MNNFNLPIKLDSRIDEKEFREFLKYQHSQNQKIKRTSYKYAIKIGDNKNNTKIYSKHFNPREYEKFNALLIHEKRLDKAYEKIINEFIEKQEELYNIPYEKKSRGGLKKEEKNVQNIIRGTMPKRTPEGGLEFEISVLVKKRQPQIKIEGLPNSFQGIPITYTETFGAYFI